ncbi:MAG: glycosyl hydrolase [Thermobacillus sp.]|uniref:beta-glucosidase n=1 Tax=Thermobacillus sp. TaxID=2108467 RepID=UPI000E3891FC|nr:glycoside hydrolase family 3 C-terminal domain-containing protein [Thermobacillus sp.]REK55966.1 MAG: glycosyl hydrolase [Thermobacillus sp.]
MDSQTPQTRDVRALVRQMTLEEKASLLSGRDFWTTKPIERLGIPSVMMTDGPHGLRKQRADADNLGLFDSVPATCFPTAAALASSWDRGLIREVGEALGEECQAEDVAILLGPGANIKRSPLCGRNFEYFSEDPYLSSEMAAHHILGVQSKGVGTSLKHYAVNNQEHRRMSVDAVVDERTLREIYLASFEGAVRQAQPWTVMCSYNKVNGTYASEHPELLTRILKEEWGHEGFVVSDWGAVNDRAAGVAAGLELEMPGNGGINDRKVVEAVRNGSLPEDVLDRAVERLLTIILRAVDSRKPGASYDADAHHRLARRAAGESMVLLRNEDGTLPLEKSGRIAVIGELAVKPRYQGGGSSHVKPTRLDNPLDEIRRSAGPAAKVVYAQGYELANDAADDRLVEEALQAAAAADVAVIFAGLPESWESEGFDRTHLRMPGNQQSLIEAVAGVQERVVVVLCNGAPVEMPWLGHAKAVLEAYLGGQAMGGAVADVLFGDVNPSGKLAETFPHKLSDNPSHLFFPGEGDRVEYREGLFVGYRYYDAKEIEPLFPFGHGLSYTTFAYEKIEIDRARMSDGETAEVRVTIANTGERAGKEIVQLYVRDRESSVIRPVKELKGFAKVELQPGERKTVTFRLGKRAFAYYEPAIRDWRVESGEFDILVGASSRDIRLQGSIYVESTVTLPWVIHRNTLIGDLLADERTAPYVRRMLEKNAPFGSAPTEELKVMLEAFLKYMPLRNIASFNRESATDLDALLEELNRLVSST